VTVWVSVRIEKRGMMRTVEQRVDIVKVTWLVMSCCPAVLYFIIKYILTEFCLDVVLFGETFVNTVMRLTFMFQGNERGI
jgi:hypothetical protein